MGDSVAEAKIKELEAKTAAAEARAAAVEKDKEDERKRQESMSMFGRLWDFAKDNFWSFAFAIIGIAIAVQTWGVDGIKEFFGKAKDFFGNLIDEGINLLPDSWQEGAKKFVTFIKGLFGGDVSKYVQEMPQAEVEKTLRGDNGEKMSPELATLIAQNKDRLLKLAKEANGKISSDMSELTNPKTLFAGMTKEPELFQNLFSTALKYDAKKSGDFTKKITASLTAIVEDDAKVKALVTGEQKTKTLNLVLSLAPQEHHERIKKAFNYAVNPTTGEPTADFKAILKDMIGEFAKSYASASPAPQQGGAGATVAAGAGTAVPAQDGTPAWFAQLDAVPQNKAAKDKLIDTMIEQGKLSEMKKVMGGDSKVSILKFAIENRAAVATFRKELNMDKLPPEAAALKADLKQFDELPPVLDKTVLKMISNGGNPIALRTIFMRDNKMVPAKELTIALFNPKNRELVEKCGLKEVSTMINVMGAQQNKQLALLNERNLGVVMRTLDLMTDSESMQQQDTAIENIKMTAALTDRLLNNDPSTLRSLGKEKLGAFMADPANATALDFLANNLDLSANPKLEAQRAVYAKHMPFIRSLMRDKDSFYGQRLLEDLLNDSQKPVECKVGDNGVGGLESVLLWAMDKTAKIMPSSISNVESTNAMKVKALLTDKHVADCVGVPVTPRVTFDWLPPHMMSR